MFLWLKYFSVDTVEITSPFVRLYIWYEKFLYVYHHVFRVVEN